ncbi:hypothetical protein [Pseudomonas sp. PS01302]|uniref:hypothetical protein n=1 Tax=Pseudomonas sp. PS01302 TaxID=2991438 RepID=UPI00249B3C11|nr:hypothetical protein [Pseudomonas sp. PS01302]
MSIQNEAVEVTVAEGFKVQLTPEILAKAFWSLGSDGQADFLDALGAVIEEDFKTNSKAYQYGELQWCHLKDELRQPGRERANNVHMSLSAFAYDYWTQKPDGARQGLAALIGNSK